MNFTLENVDTLYGSHVVIGNHGQSGQAAGANVLDNRASFYYTNVRTRAVWANPSVAYHNTMNWLWFGREGVHYVKNVTIEVAPFEAAMRGFYMNFPKTVYIDGFTQEKGDSCIHYEPNGVVNPTVTIKNVNCFNMRSDQDIWQIYVGGTSTANIVIQDVNVHSLALAGQTNTAHFFVNYFANALIERCNSTNANGAFWFVNPYATSNATLRDVRIIDQKHQNAMRLSAGSTNGQMHVKNVYYNSQWVTNTVANVYTRLFWVSGAVYNLTIENVEAVGGQFFISADPTNGNSRLTFKNITYLAHMPPCFTQYGCAYPPPHGWNRYV